MVGGRSCPLDIWVCDDAAEPGVGVVGGLIYMDFYLRVRCGWWVNVSCWFVWGGLRRRMSHDMGSYTWISILG